MRTYEKIRIALVTPPIIGHLERGTGIYTNNLYRSLNRINSLDVRLIDLHHNLSGFDVVHFPYFDPFFLTLPLFRTYKSVVTVHDLIPLGFPKYFPKGVRGWFKWRIQKLSLSFSTAVVTDSSFSKGEIIRHAGISEMKIKVVPLGISSDFRVIRSKEILAKVRKKYNLPEKFILNVGDVNYNKNIPGLLKAFRKLVVSYPDLHLVFVGRGFAVKSILLAEIKRLIVQLKLNEKIIMIGQVSLEELVSLYNLARVYIQPSYAEGFGLPVLEAMACACPVVVSNSSSLPEVAGSSAVFADPENTDNLASAISILIGDNNRRNYFIKKGLHRVKYFTWDSCALKMAEIYKSLCEKD